MTKKGIDTGKMTTRLVSVRNKDNTTKSKDRNFLIKNLKSRDMNVMRRLEGTTGEKGNLGNRIIGINKIYGSDY